MSQNHSQEILDSIRRIVRGLRISSRNAEKELGVSGAQLFVLQKLHQAGRLSVNELAEATLTHQSSVSVVVSRLVEQKLVSREKSKEDSRKTELQLTARGISLLKKVPPTPQEKILAALAEMQIKEREKLSSLLHTLVMEAGLAEEPATLFFEEEKRKK